VGYRAIRHGDDYIESNAFDLKRRRRRYAWQAGGLQPPMAADWADRVTLKRMNQPFRVANG
jgi:hypothetical protein